MFCGLVVNDLDLTSRTPVGLLQNEGSQPESKEQTPKMVEQRGEVTWLLGDIIRNDYNSPGTTPVLDILFWRQYISLFSGPI